MSSWLTANYPAPRLSAPLIIALVVHLALVVVLAAIPLRQAMTQGQFAPATVRFNFVGLAEPGGQPDAGGSGPGRDSAAPATATILQPEPVSPTTLPPAAPVVIGVFDPLAVTAATHLNIQLGSAPPPGNGSGFGHGTGTGIGDGNAAGVVGLGGPGPGGGTGFGGRPAGRHNPKPSYPELARQRGWEGTTVLLVEVRADGKVGEIAVRQSSGHRVLDDASVATVRTWEFNPARRDDAPVTTWVEVPIRYRLNVG